MLLPNTTWGQLREMYLKDVENGVESSENPLHDVKTRKESTDKKNEDFVWPEEAEKFNELMGLEPLTAAGGPEEEEWADPILSPIYFTVDEEGNVLELVKADDEGLFIRMEGKWVDISDEEDFPTVYEQEMRFATDDAVAVWDAEFEEKDDLTGEDIADYVIK